MIRPVALLSTLLLASVVADAEPRMPVEDETVVRRAEAIVVAHVEEGSIEYVPHAAGEREGRSFEHHAKLVVSEVIRGTVAAGKLPIVVHYGLVPLVDGRFEQEGGFVDVRSMRPELTKGAIEIVDDDASRPSFEGIGDDQRKDHVWLLRRPPADFLHGKANRELLGILDTADVQPLAQRGYVDAYLADDPEPAVRRWLLAHTDAPPGALRFLLHRETLRIVGEPDPARRAEKLLPAFRAATLWEGRDEARDAIEACGAAAGPYLVALLRSDEWADRQRRAIVIEMLGRVRIAAAYDAVVAVLESHDATFERAMKQPTWSQDRLKEPYLSAPYSETCAAVTALGQLGDVRAVALVERVSDRWAANGDWGRGVRERCDEALKALGATAKPR